MSKKVTVSTVLYTPYKTKDGKHNLKIRILINGKQKNISTDYYFTKEEYLELKGKTNTRKYSKEKREIIIDEIREEIKKYKLIVSGLKVLTLDALNKELNKENERYDLELFRLLDKFEKKYRDNNQITSAEKCKETKRSIKKVLNVSEMAMVDVTPAFLYEYEQKALEQGKSPTTIGMYLRYVRIAWNYCKDNDLLDYQLYPFGRKPKYTMIKSKQRKSALDKKDMNVIKDYKIEGIKRFYLDLFLLSYYTFGLNLIDILKLEHDDIYNGFIDTTRKKTKSQFKIPLTQEAKELIEKYRDTDSQYLFGKLQGDESAQQIKDRSKYYSKRINRVLKTISNEKGIKKVTFYDARHTSANNLLVNKIDIATISQLMGHKDIKTTQNYLSGLPDYDIKERVLKIAM